MAKTFDQGAKMTNYMIQGPLASIAVEIDEFAQPIYVVENEVKWLEAIWSKPYTIIVKNNTFRRIEILMSVDGQDVLQDRPARFSNSGMVIEAFGVWKNQGWRLDRNHTRDFIFTEPSGSVVAMSTGKTNNTGVIGVAVFREKQFTRPDHPMAKSTTRGGSSILGKFGSDVGTGMGRERIDRVGTTEFLRATDHPEQVVQIQYRSRKWLIDHGIIQPSATENLPSAFSDDIHTTGYRKYP